MTGIGNHYLTDLHGVAAEALRDESRLMATFAAALDAGGFHVVARASHRFAGGGGGVTGFFLLSESHLAFHTYPEFGYLALDLFSCGSARPEEALRFLTEALRPTAVEPSRHERGGSIARRLTAVR